MSKRKCKFTEKLASKYKLLKGKKLFLCGVNKRVDYCEV
jgi:hypothetical protein